MNIDITLCIGGQQGEGLSLLGKILSQTLNEYGYYIFGYRTFSSRIKGGAASTYLRINSNSVESNVPTINLLLAFDQEAIDLHAHLLSKDACIITDEHSCVNIPLNISHFSFPFGTHGKNLGNKLYGNMIALGVLSTFLSLPSNLVKFNIERKLKGKSTSMIEKNKKAFDVGYNLLHQNSSLSLPKLTKSTETMVSSGSTSLSLGFIAGGCRFMAAYPITPASEIMEFMAKSLPSLGGSLIQAEDEIAAITMAIGASYAGVRSITATSGPGLSLMSESIGFSGMTEIPLVIVDVQRAGPSTGMPTKQEQSDIGLVYYGGHGEFPKIILSPGNPEECFQDGIRSLNLAEIYQCPVFILSDLKLALSEYTAKIPSYHSLGIDRGKLKSQEELDQREDPYYPRYNFTEDNISPRTLPGQKNGPHYTTGVEHNEWGRVDTSPDMRIKMHDKRMNKLKSIELENSFVHNQSSSRTLLVGCGSTKGVLDEIFYKYRNEKYTIDTLQLRVFSPFPTKSLHKLLKEYQRILFIENNATSQLRNLFQNNLKIDQKTHTFNKYNGEFIHADEIIHFIKGVFANDCYSL